MNEQTLKNIEDHTKETAKSTQGIEKDTGAIRTTLPNAVERFLAQDKAIREKAMEQDKILREDALEEQKKVRITHENGVATIVEGYEKMAKDMNENLKFLPKLESINSWMQKWTLVVGIGGGILILNKFWPNIQALFN